MQANFEILNKREFVIIRILFIIALVIFGAVEFYGNQQLFSGMIRVFGFLFLLLTFITSLCGLSLGRSNNAKVRATALKGEAIALPIAFFVCAIWYFGGSDYDSTVLEYAAYEKREAKWLEAKKAANEMTMFSANAYNQCRQRLLGGIGNKDTRNERLGDCNQLAPAAQDVGVRPVAPKQTPEALAHEWTFWIRILNLVALAVTTGMISRLGWVAAAAKSDPSEEKTVPSGQQSPTPRVEIEEERRLAAGFAARGFTAYQPPVAANPPRSTVEAVSNYRADSLRSTLSLPQGRFESTNFAQGLPPLDSMKAPVDLALDPMTDPISRVRSLPAAGPVDPDLTVTPVPVDPGIGIKKTPGPKKTGYLTSFKPSWKKDQKTRATIGVNLNGKSGAPYLCFWTMGEYAKLCQATPEDQARMIRDRVEGRHGKVIRREGNKAAAIAYLDSLESPKVNEI